MEGMAAGNTSEKAPLNGRDEIENGYQCLAATCGIRNSHVVYRYVLALAHTAHAAPPNIHPPTVCPPPNPTLPPRNRTGVVTLGMRTSAANVLTIS